MVNLYFDVRDVSRAARLGWSGKKIRVGLCGLIVAYVGYTSLAILAHLMAAIPFSGVWEGHGFLLPVNQAELPLLARAIEAIAVAYALVVVLLTSCAICKMTYQQLREKTFYSSTDAWRFLGTSPKISASGNSSWPGPP